MRREGNWDGYLVYSGGDYHRVANVLSDVVGSKGFEQLSRSGEADFGVNQAAACSRALQDAGFRVEYDGGDDLYRVSV